MRYYHVYAWCIGLLFVIMWLATDTYGGTRYHGLRASPGPLSLFPISCFHLTSNARTTEYIYCGQTQPGFTNGVSITDFFFALSQVGAPVSCLLPSMEPGKQIDLLTSVSVLAGGCGVCFAALRIPAPAAAARPQHPPPQTARRLCHHLRPCLAQPGEHFGLAGGLWVACVHLQLLMATISPVARGRDDPWQRQSPSRRFPHLAGTGLFRVLCANCLIMRFVHVCND